MNEMPSKSLSITDVVRQSLGGKPMSTATTRASLLALMIATLFEDMLLQRSNRLQTFIAARPSNLIVGYPPGAGYDTYGRALAQFMGKFIPGKPAVVVQNMPGASSLKGLQYLATQAPRDGTVIGIFNPQLVNLFDARAQYGNRGFLYADIARQHVEATFKCASPGKVRA